MIGYSFLRYWQHVVFTLVAISAAAIPALAQDQQTVQQATKSAQLSTLDEAPDLADSVKVIRWLQEAKVPALGLGAIRDGRLQKVKVYGDLVSGHPATPHSIFNVASITKAMTSVLVLRLVSAGAWDLDEPLYHYWTDPDVASDPRSKVITTRHVLHQQSGFPNWRREFKDRRLAFLAQPGTAYRYSGEGFEYLRWAIESKFHQPMDRLADSILFRPLGMKDTHYTWSDRTDTARMAVPHDAQGKPLEWERNHTPNAADLVTTTIPDLAKFLVSVMNREGLAASVADEMVRPAVATKPNRFIGLCWFIYTPLESGAYAISHGGDDAGMHTICFLLPKTREGLIIFTNSDNGPKLYAALLKACLGKNGKAIVDIEMK
jgi:CubicO group peptidase (beta-lactamase class C family)